MNTATYPNASPSIRGTRLSPEKQAEHIAALIRELYKTNEGPRLIAGVMEEFPHPRKVWNEADVGLPARWGMRATEYSRR